MYGYKSWTINKAECQRIDAFEMWCWRTLESPLDCKEIQLVHPKGYQSFKVEAETPKLWPPDEKSWLIWKDPDAGRDWGQEEKGTTEDEMIGWHRQLNEHGFGWTLGVDDGQGDLACCSSWSCRQSDTTERLNWTELTLLHLLKLWIPLTTAFWDCCSVAMLCPGLCNCMEYSLPGFSVLQLSPRVCSNSCPLSRWCHPTISSSFVPFSSCLQSFPASGSSLMSWLFTSGGWSIGVSASASVLPMNIQGWFPLGLTGLISLQSKGLSRVFSTTTVWKHQFFGTQPSLWTNSRIHTWLLETSMISYSTFIHEYTLEYI